MRYNTTAARESRRQIFWLDPLSVEALEWFREKHGHAERHGTSAAIRLAIVLANKKPISADERKALKELADKYRRPVASGGLLCRNRPGEGWEDVSPRLDQECWTEIKKAKEEWELETDQSAVRFLLVAAAVRGGFEIEVASATA